VYSVPLRTGGEPLPGVATGGRLVPGTIVGPGVAGGRAAPVGSGEPAMGGSDGIGAHGWPGTHGVTGGAGWLRTMKMPAITAIASNTPTKTATIGPAPIFDCCGGWDMNVGWK
jgi:hypothetical protein